MDSKGYGVSKGYGGAILISGPKTPASEAGLGYNDRDFVTYGWRIRMWCEWCSAVFGVRLLGWRLPEE